MGFRSSSGRLFRVSNVSGQRDTVNGAGERQLAHQKPARWGSKSTGCSLNI